MYGGSLRTADAFPVVASLPPKNMLFFGGREATTGNASAVRRLVWWPTTAIRQNDVNLLILD